MKRILISLLCSLCLTLIGAWVNYNHYLNTRHLLLAKKTWGGECMNENGFGINVFHTYGMTPDQVGTDSLRFDPISFLITLLLIAAVIYLILFLIHKLKEGRSL